MPKVSISISELEFKGSPKYSLNCSPNDIIVFVGANNCGKTTCLKEIVNFTTKEVGVFESRFFEKIKFHNPNSIEEFKAFIREFGTKNPTAADQYTFTNHSFGLDHFASLWNQEHSSYQTRALFIHDLKTEERLTLTSKSNSRMDYTSQTPASPLQKIDYDDKLAASVSKIFSKLFFKDLVIDHHSGSVIALRVGIKPDYTKENDRLSNDYRDKLRGLAKLEEQGDGVRSAAGIILELWTSSLRTILMIDEPEAFLHPPQAKELGKIIANQRPEGQQLFIATHSGDFIKGLMEASNSNVHIVRVTRDSKDVTAIKILQNDDLKNLLKNSWLKYSNALDSIFYQETILCEADVDGRFYNAILDSCVWEGAKPETFFLPCGGKGKFKKAADHLMKLGVKPKIIADIDILVGRDGKDDTKILFEKLGGDYSEIKERHIKLRNHIWSNHKNEKELEKSELYKKIKKNGKVEFGELKNDFEFIAQKCSEVGLFILQVGELESWYEAAGKSDVWLSEVFDQVQDFSSDPKLMEARNFVAKIFESQLSQDASEAKA